MSVKQEILGSKKIRRSGRLNSCAIAQVTDFPNYRAGHPTLSRPFAGQSTRKQLAQ